MSNEYKGLTITIAGDTTKLQTALKAATSAAADTQTQLTAINKALTFDPESIEAATDKIELLRDRAVALSAQLVTLEDAAEQLRSTVTGINGMTVEELAEYTENAALKAKLADERYNAVNATLESMYNSIEGKVNEALEDMYDAINDAARGSEEFGDTFDMWKVDNLEEVVEQLEQAGILSESDAKKVLTLNECLDMSNVDEVEDAVDQLAEMGVVTDEEADKLVTVRGNWEDAFTEKSATNAVLQLQQIETQTEKVAAEVKSVNKLMAAMEVPSDVARGVSDVTDEVDTLTAYIKTCTEKAEKADEALQLNPESVEALSTRSEALADALDAAKEKAELLDEVVDAYEAAGIDELAESTKDAAAAAEEANAEWVAVADALDRAEAELELVTSRQQSLVQTAQDSGEAYDEVCDEVERLTYQVEDLAEQEEAAREARELATAVVEYEDLQKQVKETAEEVENLEKSSEYAAEAMEDGCDQSALSLVSLGSGIRDVGDALSELSSVASQVFDAIIESADEVDSAYRDMLKTVDGTEEEYEELYDAAIAFASTSTVSADAILEIMALGGQMGIAIEDLEVFAETVANLTIASDLEAEEAAEELGQLANILDDLNADTMPNFSDALVRLGNNCATSESDILNIASRIGSMASIVGMSTSDILAWSASIAETGMNAEAAGTAIANTLSDIETAVSAGGDDLEAFAEVAQMSAEEFAEAWESDPTTALQAFIEGLVAIEDSGGSADATLEELGITGTRQKQALEGLMQTIDGLNDNLTMSEDAWNGVSDEWGDAGDAANEAAAKSEGFSGALTRIQNIAQGLAADIGDSLTPVLNVVADVLAALASVIEDLPDGAKLAITAVTGLLSVSGTGAQAVGNLVQAIGKIGSSGTTAKQSLTGVSNAASTLATKSTLSAAAMKAFQTSVAAIAVSAAIAGIATLVEWLQEQREETELLNEATKTYDELLGEVSASSSAASEASTDWGEVFGEIADAARDATEELAEFNEEIVETLSTVATDEALLEGYVETIEELANQSDLSAVEQAELVEAVDALNEILGTTYEVTDAVNGVIEDETGAVLENVKAIWAQVEAYEAEAEVAAYESLLAEAREELAEAQLAYSDAVQSYYDMLSDDSAYQKWYDENYTLLGLYQISKDAVWELWEQYVESESGISSTLEELSADIEGYQDKIDGLTASMALALADLDDELEDAVLVMGTSMRAAGADAAIAFAEGVESGTLTVDEAVAALEVAATGDWTETVQLLYDSGLSISETVAEGIADGTYEVDEATMELLLSIATDFESDDQGAASAAFGLGSDVIDALTSAIEAGETTVDQAVDVIQLAAEGDWDGITAYYESIGASLPEALADAIEAASSEAEDEAYDLGENCTNATNQAFEDSTSYQESTTTWVDNLVSWVKDLFGIASPSTVFIEIGEQCVAGLSEGIENGSGSAESSASTLAQAVLSGVSGLVSSLTSTGSSAASGLSSAISSGSTSAYSAASSLASSSKSAVSGLASSLGSEASSASSSFATGIKKYYSTLVSNASAMASAAAQIASGKSSASTWGSDLGKNFAAGLKSAVTTVKSAANYLASVVQSILGFSVPEEGPWSGAEKGGVTSGRHLAENFAAGMCSGVSEVEAAAQALAEAASLDAAVDAVQAETAAAVESAAYGVGADVEAAQASGRDRTDELLAAIEALASSSSQGGTVVNQSFETKVVRSDSDLYTAAPIIYRNAMREAAVVSS